VIKAVIFDCFGVIVADALSAMTRDLMKTNPDAWQRIKALLNEANTGRASSEEISVKIAAVFGMPYPDYRAHLDLHEVKDQDLLDYIGDLRATYKTALLSNIPKDSLSKRFSNAELTKYFDVVVASGEIGYAKPEARAYEITAEQLGVRLDECVFTDDRQPYCDGADAVGMQTILYTDFADFRTQLQTILANSQ
jgi:HAD superfamily hydrolase (TIGR01509 family)